MGSGRGSSGGNRGFSAREVPDAGWTTVYGRKRGNFTSYFFSNFPDNFGEEAMWRIFNRYDKVWEVYIPQRRTK